MAVWEQHVRLSARLNLGYGMESAQAKGGHHEFLVRKNWDC